MKYNPQIHHRRSIRLQGYDYSCEGAYFITICCHNRECRFGKIENDKMILDQYGRMAHDEWGKLTERFSNVELDVFQIMPNHMHGIIVLNSGIVRKRAGASPAPTAGSIGDIIGAYKSLVANTCLEIYKANNETMGKLWQRNYFEHIIRNEQSYRQIAEYIINNPQKWQEDKWYQQ